MVVIVFRIHRRIDSSHRWPLGMAHAYPPFPVYVFCKGDELVVKRLQIQDFNKKKINRAPAMRGLFYGVRI